MRVGKKTIQFGWLAVLAWCATDVVMAQTRLDAATDANGVSKPNYTMYAASIDDTVARGPEGCGNDPNCVSCEPGYNCPPVELVFIVDTSGSMRDEADALCSQINSIVNELASLGVNVAPTLLGITNTGDAYSFGCLDDDVVNLLGSDVPGFWDTCVFPGGDADFESWGPATAIVAESFDWNPAATKFIVPISDEAPCNGSRPNGCNDPGDDRDSITNAASVALLDGVIVSPIVGTGSDACTIMLAQSIAQQTGGEAHVLADAAADLRDAILGTVLAACELDTSCDDLSACTTDDACVNGRCAGTPTYNVDAICCDPRTGNLVELDDGNDCSDDVCDPTTGQVTHSESDIGTPCDDLSECTYDDFCDDAGVCVGNQVDGMPCKSDADCHGQSCDLDSGTCVCSDTPKLCLSVRDPSAGVGCHKVGDEVVVDINLGYSTNVIVGGDLYFSYDPSILRFDSIVPGQAVDPTSPFALEIFRSIDQNAGTVYFSTGIDLGGYGTRGPTLMAQVRFTALTACASDELCWQSNNPKHTKLSNNKGQAVEFESCCSGPIYIDSSNFDFTCPQSAVLNAAPGAPGPVRTWDAPTASSDCENQMDVKCTATHSDGFNIDALIPNGGRFPSGTSSFTCTASNECGQAGECSWTIEATGVQPVIVDLELSPTITSGQDGTTLKRCIEFELYSNCSTDPVVISKTIDFGPPFDLQGQAIGVELDVPPGDYQCITARDPLHSIRSVSPMVVQGDHYYASFKGDPHFGGNWLVCGNLDGNGAIDVMDFGLFVDFYETAAATDTPCGTGGVHADFNGDGYVDDADWQFISDHLDTIDSPSCCSTTAGIEPMVSEISVRELKSLGLDELIKADLNGDGLLNRTDVELFEAQGISAVRIGKQPREGRDLRPRSDSSK